MKYANQSRYVIRLIDLILLKCLRPAKYKDPHIIIRGFSECCLINFNADSNGPRIRYYPTFAASCDVS